MTCCLRILYFLRKLRLTSTIVRSGRMTRVGSESESKTFTFQSSCSLTPVILSGIGTGIPRERQRGRAGSSRPAPRAIGGPEAGHARPRVLTLPASGSGRGLPTRPPARNRLLALRKETVRSSLRPAAREAIDSGVWAGYTVETVVVDNASSDGSAAMVAAEFPVPP